MRHFGIFWMCLNFPLPSRLIYYIYLKEKLVCFASLIFFFFFLIDSTEWDISNKYRLLASVNVVDWCTNKNKNKSSKYYSVAFNFSVLIYFNRNSWKSDILITWTTNICCFFPCMKNCIPFISAVTELHFCKFSTCQKYCTRYFQYFLIQNRRQMLSCFGQ